MQKLGKIKEQLEARLKELGAKVEEIEGDLRTPRSASWEDRATEIEGEKVSISRCQGYRVPFAAIRWPKLSIQGADECPLMAICRH